MMSSSISCEEDPFQLLSSPLTFSAINAGAASMASMQYRSTTSSSGDSSQIQTTSMFGHEDSKPALSFVVPSQVHKSVISMQTPLSFHDHDESSAIQFSLNTIFPKSKCPEKSPFSLDADPLEIFTSSSIEMDDVGESLPSAPPFPFCNPLNSCVMQMASHRVLEVLSCILRAFVGDIDFTMDTAQCHIDGVVFVCDHAVYFMLYIHQSFQEEDEGLMDTPQSTIEYRRKSGDAMGSATFWNYIQHQMQLRCGGTANPMEVDPDGGVSVDDNGRIIEEEEFEFVADDQMNIDSVHDFDGKAYLDQIIVSMEQNEQWMVDELRCLYQSATKTLCGDMLRHRAFLKVLTKEALFHQNVSVSRLAILILQQMSLAQGGCTELTSGSMQKLKLFEAINKLLCCHRPSLIKKHAIRLLDRLADAPSWNIQEIDKTQLLWRIKQCGREFPEDDEMRSMIEKVNAKVNGN